ncbi:MAG: thiamine phosphate synthase [Marmoricola sp.]
MVPRIFCLVGSTDPLELLPELAAAGVDGFQVRAKRATDAELYALACAVLGAVRPYGARVLVDDRLDVALAARADGVHLGRADLPVAAARRVAGDLLVGATCRCREHVERARAEGADYAGLGPVFATASKHGLPSPLGVAAVREADGVLPLVAIGGITTGRAREVRVAGATGVAVLGGIWREPDPLAAARELVGEVA